MKKRIITFLMAVMLVLSFAACGNTAQSGSSNNTGNKDSQQTAQNSTASDNTSGTVSAKTDVTAKDGKTLVVYFSWSSAGNTEKMATYIQQQTGADILELIPAVPYPTDYNETGNVAKTERDENQRPEISNLPDSISQYSKILVGYPIWWHTAPMIIGTFLDNYDLTGVDIYPFTQSASMDTEQFNNSMDFVRENAPKANVHNGLFVEPSNTEKINEYLNNNGLLK